MSKELELFPKELPSVETNFTTRYRTIQDLANSTMCVPNTKAFDNSSFNQGANKEIERLRNALEKGSATEEWLREPFSIPPMTYNQMIEYLDGADIIRQYAGQMIAHGGKMDESTILLCWKHAKHLRIK